jgi:hypothetical protein
MLPKSLPGGSTPSCIITINIIGNIFIQFLLYSLGKYNV